MYKTLNEYYKEKFGCKVYKLSVDGGFTCPNRDGTKSYGGCIFCSKAGSGDFAESGTDILLQLENAKKRVEQKNKSGKYIAYFQAFTNTYANAEVLREKYLTAISPDYIVGIAIATRPDCIDESVIEVLKEINRIKPVSVELGLQTVNEKTAEFINRNYSNESYFNAVKLLKESSIEVVTHVILGLPFETEQDALNTTRAAVLAGSCGVKFHLLHVLKGTELENYYNRGEFSCLTLEEYAFILKKCINLLPKETVVHRITGDGAKKDLIAPLWSANKKAVLNYLKEYLN